MKLSFHHLYLLSLAGFSIPVYSKPTPESPLQVLVDLIFPQNNTEYKPVYPFPIIFSLRNFSTAWSDRPLVDWRLIQINGAQEGRVAGGLVGWKDGLVAPPETDQTSIIDSEIIPNHNISRWILEYTFQLGSRGCHGSSTGVHPSHLPGNRGRVRFSTNIDTGVMPTSGLAGSCATPLGSVAIIGNNESDSTCSPLQKPNPVLKPCGYSIESPLVDRITAEMTKASQCKNGTWPSGTGIGRRCPNDIRPLQGSAMMLKLSKLVAFQMVIMMMIAVLFI